MKREIKESKDTPETDAKISWYGCSGCGPIKEPAVDVEFCRRLERERDEAREALRRLDSIYRKDLDEAPKRPEWISKHLNEQ